MLVRITVVVEEVGEAYQVVDLSRVHRLGAGINEVLEEIERAHAGVAVLEHVIVARTEPAKGDVMGPVLIR